MKITWKKFVVALAAMVWLSIGYADAQTGCTDPQALNFDASAVENDGSCTYPATTYLPPLVANLPAVLEEASGLEFFNQQAWIHQDGGVPPQLFTVDTLTGEVLQTLPLPSIANHDWEDLAEDGTHLYIGDFGNNAGNRTDLRIYKINKNDLLAGTATADTIDFSYSDQTDFTISNLETRHDCEAFLAAGDSLYLFSKDWIDLKTRCYVLPKTPGTHVAQLRDSLEVGGLITAADVSFGGKVVLLGYNLSTLEVFLWLLFDYPGDQFFSGNKRKISLGTPLNIGQAEGIAFSSETEGFICSESYSILPARLNRFDIRQWVENPSSSVKQVDELDFSASPNPFLNTLSIDFQGVALEGAAAFSLFSADGRQVLDGVLQSGKNTVRTADLPKGRYILIVKNGGKTAVQTLLKQ